MVHWERNPPASPSPCEDMGKSDSTPRKISGYKSRAREAIVDLTSRTAGGCLGYNLYVIIIAVTPSLLARLGTVSVSALNIVTNTEGYSSTPDQMR